MTRVRLVGTIGGRRRIITIRTDDSVIGSAPGADFVLDDPAVAPRHARIVRVGDTFQISAIADTSLNGRQINGRTILRAGDAIQLGAPTFTVEIIADSTNNRPTAAERRPPAARLQSKRNNLKGLIALIGILVVIGFSATLAFIDWDQIESIVDGDHAGSSDVASPANHPVQTHRDSASATTPVLEGRRPVPMVRADAAPWLKRLNYYRSLAELGPVEEDSDLSAANLLHARYLVKNYSDAIKAGHLGAEVHTEEAGNLWYTTAGATAAHNSDVEEAYFPEGVPVSFSPTATVDGLITVPFHRLTILNPSLGRAGYAQFCENGVCAGALDIGSSADKRLDSPAPLSTPIMFPPNGSELGLRSFSDEWPDPLTACPGFSAPTGLPLTLQLGAFVEPQLSNYSLSREGSPPTQLEVCGFDAATYNNPDATQNERAKAILRARGAVVLIPRAPLEPGRYTVSITAVRDYKWNFAIE